MEENKRLVQSLASKVVDLEGENARLKREVSLLAESQRSLSSKNKLFEAKILELQARLLYSAPRPTGGAHWADGTPRFRSPLIKDESGSLVYRFEKRPHSARPVGTGGGGGAHSSVWQTARDDGRSRPGSAQVNKLSLGRVSHAGTSKGGSMSARGVRPAHAASPSDAPVRGGASAASNDKPSEPQGATDGAGLMGQQALAKVMPPSVKMWLPPAPDAPAAEKGMEGLEELGRDLEAGFITSETSLVIEAAYCIDTGNKALTVRHNPARYREAAEQLERAVEVTFKGWRVSTKLSEHEWSAASAFPAADADGGRVASLPLGAFEVSLSWESDGEMRSSRMHSKLQSRKFPDTFAMLSSLVKLVGAHAEKLQSTPTDK